MNEKFLSSGFRWFGDKDAVSLDYIRQAGVESVYSSLHDIPYGELWTVNAILAHKKKIEDKGMRWDVVESLPVSEEIKTRTGNYSTHIENYKKSIENLAECGVNIVIYNFMPVLDWIRTDLKFELPDGSRCLKFEMSQFAAFELFFLKRQGAEKNYTGEVYEKAKAFYDSLNEDQKKAFEKNITDVFPGCKWGLGASDIQNMCDKYKNIDAEVLKNNLRLFLEEVVPVAEKCGVILAIHPDDPPFDVLGLPRIASRLKDFQDIISYVDSPSNSVAFCTGSLSASPKNNIPEMIDALKERIFVVHLRSTQHLPDGSFYEAGHLEGSVPMYEVVKKLLTLQHERQKKGGKRIIFRPDHGRDMADDLSKPPAANPGYTYIGRMKGLAEIRGLQLGIIKSLNM